MRPGAAERADLTWPLDRERLAGLRFRWPSEYHSRTSGLQPARRSPLAQKTASVRQAMVTMARTETAEIPQPYGGIVLIEVVSDGTRARYEVAIDQRDEIDIDEECAGRCLVYFKRQHARDGYSRANVLPGGYIPLKQDALHRNLDRLRSADRRSREVYGRFSSHFAPGIRGRVLQLLTEQNRFDFTGGPALTMYTQYLREVAGSHVCVDVPGQGPLSYRLVEYLALGSCIVAFPHEARLHVPLVDREHIAYAKEDLSDLVDLCDFYLSNPHERQRLEANARDYFDRYLHRDQLAAYHLHSILERL
jgi:hypothetical protein